MNITGIASACISPDGSAAVVNTWSPDYEKNFYRYDLSLWTRQTGQLQPLTHGESDSSPVWSPDGKYVAFASFRAAGRADRNSDEQTHRVWIVAVDGGKPFPLYTEKLKVHAFDWSADSSTIYFSLQEPLSKTDQDQNDAEWKDVVRYRQQDRGDVLLGISLESALNRAPHRGARNAATKPAGKSGDDREPLPADAHVICRTPLQIDEMEVSPDGKQIALVTQSPSERLENPSDNEIFLVPATGAAPRQLTHNQAVEANLHWSPDGRRIYFAVPEASGSVEGPYQDLQGRLFVLDAATGAITRLGADFSGSWESYTVTADEKVLACGVKGLAEHLYRITGKTFTEIASSPGAYDNLDASRRGSGQLLYTHSAINEPTQVFVSDEDDPANGKAITQSNPIFNQRAPVQWKPCHWKSSDGTTLEGLLIYPPGKLEQKHLPMLTLIHGGPADADGNRFDAGWYDWATLAAAKGWLVFQPNYRGSTGYGDPFMLAISPHAVSLPAGDILSGVDALVKNDIADPDHLAVGGYSYGGYLTDWIITQTTRFKAALAGAGAVEQAVEWGTDDSTFDDASYLSGTPWEKPDIYVRETALFQMANVKTPTLIIGGDNDIRVSYIENVVLERALQKLGVPHELLTFPGEGHGLDNNPWHGYITVREELKWLQKYAAPAGMK